MPLKSLTEITLTERRRGKKAIRQTKHFLFISVPSSSTQNSTCASSNSSFLLVFLPLSSSSSLLVLVVLSLYTSTRHLSSHRNTAQRVLVSTVNTLRKPRKLEQMHVSGTKSIDKTVNQRIIHLTAQCNTVHHSRIIKKKGKEKNIHFSVKTTV